MSEADHTPAAGVPSRILLVSKDACHLCALARQVIARVADDLGVGWEEKSISEFSDPDPVWFEQLPITFVDGEQHDYWRVSESRLRAALAATPTAAARA